MQLDERMILEIRQWIDWCWRVAWELEILHKAEKKSVREEAEWEKQKDIN